MKHILLKFKVDGLWVYLKLRKHVGGCALYQSAYGFLACCWLGESHISILLTDACGNSGWVGIKFIIAYGCLRET